MNRHRRGRVTEPVVAGLVVHGTRNRQDIAALHCRPDRDWLADAKRFRVDRDLFIDGARRRRLRGRESRFAYGNRGVWREHERDGNEVESLRSLRIHVHSGGRCHFGKQSERGTWWHGSSTAARFDRNMLSGRRFGSERLADGPRRQHAAKTSRRYDIRQPALQDPHIVPAVTIPRTGPRQTSWQATPRKPS